MPITQITYSRNFAIGPFLYETIGATVTLGENQDPKIAISELNKLACEWNEQNNPHLAQSIAQPPEPEKLPEIQVEKPIGRSMVEQIMSCQEEKVLLSYRLLVNKNPEWEAAYNLRMGQLQDSEKAITYLNQPITNDK